MFVDSSLHRHHQCQQQQQLNSSLPVQLHCPTDRPADILTEIVCGGGRIGLAGSVAAGFKHRRAGLLLTTDAYSHVRRAAGEAGGTRRGRCRRTEERKHVEACRRVQQRATMTETWFTRRRIISPRQYCLSCAFYSSLAPHVRPSVFSIAVAAADDDV